MKRSILPLLALALLLALAACQKPAPPTDYGPRFDALSAQLEEPTARLEALSGDVDVLTTAVAGVKGDVGALASQAQALTTVSQQVSGLVGVVQRLDPANSAMLTIQHAPGVELIVATGACDGNLPPADETAYRTDTRTITRLGLPPGPTCITSTDPPAQLEVTLQPGQLVGVYFNAPPAAE